MLEILVFSDNGLSCLSLGSRPAVAALDESGGAPRR
jgi:hypothetical protein